MPCAFLSARSWIASFRRMHGREKRRVRISIDLIPPIDTRENRKAAKAYAEDCERCVRMLETAPIGELIARAEQLDAITADQAATLRGEAPAAAPIAQAKPITPQLIALAESHPSSRAEPLEQALRHKRDLEEFIAWAKIDRIQQLTLEIVQDWIAHLVAKGWAWDSRRHALLWLRRAAMMGARDASPNVIHGFRLDRRKIGDRTVVAALTRDELIALIRVLLLEKDKRPLLAVVLGGCLGLRPSETFRMPIGGINLDQQALHTGHKNEASIRDLPLPLMLCKWLAAEIGDRPKSDPLFRTISNRGARAFTKTTWSQWLGPILRTATGRDDIQAKSLRKTFSTVSARDLWPAIELEAFLGHESSQVSAITSRSYLADYRVQELRPAAHRINRLLMEAGYTKRATKSQAVKQKGN